MNKVLITHNEPESPISECFRTLGTNIQFRNFNKELKTILITSTMQSEGKSTVVANLAIAFAQSRKKVIIIDADLRRPQQHKIFGITRQLGLSNYLLGIDDNWKNTNEHISKYIIGTEVENLDILPAGTISHNPSELLASNKNIRMISALEQAYDIIIFDGTSCGFVTDSIILSSIADTTLIVASYKETKTDNLKKIKKEIENVGGNIGGVVLNKFPISKGKYKETYYYGSSEYGLNGIASIDTINEKEKDSEKWSEEIEKLAINDKAKDDSDEYIEEVLEKKENIQQQINAKEIEEKLKEKLEDILIKLEDKIDKLDCKIGGQIEATRINIEQDLESKMYSLNTRIEEVENVASNAKGIVEREVANRIYEIYAKIEEIEGTTASTAMNVKENIEQEISVKIEEIKNQIKELENSKIVEKAIIEETKNELNKMNNKIKELEGMTVSVKESLALEIDNRVYDLNTRIEELEGIAVYAKESVGQEVDSKIEELKEKINELETSKMTEGTIVKDTEDALNEMYEKMTELEKMMLNAKGSIEQEVEHRIYELSTKVERVEDEAENLKMAKDMGRMANEEVTSQINELENRAEEIESAIMRAKKSIEQEMNSKLEKIEKTVKTKESRKQEADSKIKAQNAKIEELENKIKKLEEKQKKSDKEISQAEKTVDLRDLVGREDKHVWYTKPEKKVKLYEIEVVVGRKGKKIIKEINDSLVTYQKKIR